MFRAWLSFSQAAEHGTDVWLGQQAGMVDAAKEVSNTFIRSYEPRHDGYASQDKPTNFPLPNATLKTCSTGRLAANCQLAAQTFKLLQQGRSSRLSFDFQIR